MEGQNPTSGRLLGVSEPSGSRDEPAAAPRPTWICYGRVICNVVGRKCYSGKAGPGERVFLQREPLNDQDSNAIRVLNSLGHHVGYIERGAAPHFASLIDGKKAQLSASITGHGTSRSLPCLIDVLGPDDPAHKDAIHSVLRKLGWTESAKREGWIRYGRVACNVIGIEHSFGMAGPGERVFLHREPLNDQDSKAIRVLNSEAQHVGYIERGAAPHFASLIDGKKADLSACITGPGTSRSLPCLIDVLGPDDPEHKDAIHSVLRKLGMIESAKREGWIRYGRVACNVVGIEHSSGMAGPGERVFLHREPLNDQDPSAIRVLNSQGQHIGYIERGAARHFASLIDGKKADLSACITGPGTSRSLPCLIDVLGPDDPAHKDAIHSVLRKLGMTGIALGRRGQGNGCSCTGSPSTINKDSNAIRVFNSQGHHVGYIERGAAPHFASLIDEKKADLSACVTGPGTSRSLPCLIDVLGPDDPAHKDAIHSVLRKLGLAGKDAPDSSQSPAHVDSNSKGGGDDDLEDRERAPLLGEGLSRRSRPGGPPADGEGASLG